LSVNVAVQQQEVIHVIRLFAVRADLGGFERVAGFDEDVAVGSCHENLRM
jgi:hypothetical protein